MDNGAVPKITMDELKHKLKRLSTLDRQRKVPGANIHKYERHPVSEAELEQLEDELGVRLPADYRQFLREVGYGAGPHYGLLGPKQVLEAMREEGSEWPDSKTAPGRPFPFTREQAEECFRIMGECRDGSLVGRTWPVDGCIPICYEGCTFYSLIVTAGDLAGSIWSSNIDGHYYGVDEFRFAYNLAPRPPGIIDLPWAMVLAWEPALSPEPTFLEWYNAWLDQCLDPQQWKGGQPQKWTAHSKAPVSKCLFWAIAAVALILAIIIIIVVGR